MAQEVLVAVMLTVLITCTDDKAVTLMIFFHLCVFHVKFRLY